MATKMISELSAHSGAVGANDLLLIHDASESETKQIYVSALVGVVFRPEQYGAVGDGVTDDTSDIQDTFDAAASAGGIIYLSGTYLCADVEIASGVRKIFGHGTLKGNGSTPTSVLNIDETVTNLHVSVNIDMSNDDAVAINVEAGASGITFDKCHLYDFGTVTTKSRHGIKFNAGCHDIKIINSTFDGYEDYSGSYTANAISLYGTGTEYGGFYDTPTDPTDPCYNIIIIGNHFNYFEVAIDVLASCHVTIDENIFYKQQTRAVYIVNASHHVTIGPANQFIGYLASAIAIGYCSHHIDINGIQARQISGYNTYGGAYTIGISAGAHHVNVNGGTIHAMTYYAVHCYINVSYVNIEGLTVSEHARAAIAIENEYIPLDEYDEAALFHNPQYGAPASGTQWASDDTHDIIIKNCHIQEGYSGSPSIHPGGIYIAQYTKSGGTSYYTRNITVENNDVLYEHSDTYPYYWYEDTAGYLSDNVFVNNHSIGTIKERVYLSNGRAHFDVCHGNDAIDTEVVGLTDGDTTPSVAKGGYFYTQNTGATSITDFDDGVAGQEIIVKLDANTTLVYNGAKIYLKDATDATGATNGIITLKKWSAGSAWVEVSRSF